MTNNHVLHEKSDYQNVIVQFNYENDTNLQVKQTYNYELDPEAFFVTNKDLDFTKVKVKPSPDLPELSHWGFLELESTLPNIGDRVTIIQHPQGRPKEIAMNDNKIVHLLDETLEYTTDTQAGSSGSPVLNLNWKVVGLHRSASNRETNIATKMELILKELGKA